MTEAKYQFKNQEVIDLRRVIRFFLRYWWILVIGMLVFSILPFIYHNFLKEDVYQTKAYILVSPPNLQDWQPAGVSLVRDDFDYPEGKVFEELALSEDFVAKTEKNLKAAGGFHKQLRVDSIGNSFFVFEVTGKDPALITSFAEAWSQDYVEYINTIFGSSDSNLKTLEIQVEKKWQEVLEKEEDLVASIDAGKLSRLNFRVDEIRSALDIYQKRVDQNQLLGEDVQVFRQKIATQDPKSSLSNADKLTLYSLQQRWVHFDGDRALEITESSLLGEDLTVGDAIQQLDNLRDMILRENDQIRNSINQLEDEFVELSAAVEQEKFTQNTIIQKRDQAWDSYRNIAADLENREMQVALNETWAQMVSDPAQPTSPINTSDILRDSILFGMLGAVLSSCLIIFVVWWNNPQKDDDNA